MEIGSRLGQPSVDFSKVFICLRQNFCSGNLEQKVQVYLVRIVRAASASVWSCFERSGPISRKVEISSLILFSTWVLSPWIRSKTEYSTYWSVLRCQPFPKNILFLFPNVISFVVSICSFLSQISAFPEKPTFQENDLRGPLTRQSFHPRSFLTVVMRIRLNERCFPAKKIRRFLQTIFNSSKFQKILITEIRGNELMGTRRICNFLYETASKK